jgi:DNA modification methylase
MTRLISMQDVKKEFIFIDKIMAYQKQYNGGSCTLRNYKKLKKKCKDGESLYVTVSFKLKEKRFARPIILTGKMAREYFLDMWRATGWKEGDEW